jgi:uncharacterized RDD family membrane protein YckC
MQDAMQFETPENVRVQYTLAGLGTRFIAWFVDQIFVTVLMVIVMIVLAIAGFSLAGVLDDLVEKNSDSPERVGRMVIGLMILLMGLGSFVYFTCLELFMRGQTIGKRICKIRVVKVDGFALDAGSILLRNIFRVLDHFPLMWIVPVMSQRAQRAGDMVGGTIVITDEAPQLTEVRLELSERKAVEAEFRFDARSLQNLTEVDIDAVERLLDRWGDLGKPQRDELVQNLTRSLVAKLKVEPPPAERRQRFLEDLLAAELRRQNRLLA